MSVTMKNNITFSLSLLALSCLQANAAPTITNPPLAVIADGTGYSTLVAESVIELGDAMEPIQFGQMVLCFTNLGGASLLPGRTTDYKAIADFGLCVANDSGRAEIANFTIRPTPASAGVLQSTRMWAHMNSQTFHVKTVISAGVSAANHMGEWQIDWQKQNPNSAGVNNLDNGHIKSATVGGFNEYTFANVSAEVGQAEKETLAKFRKTSSEEGAGRVKVTRSGVNDPSNNGIINYTMAYNETFVHIKEDNDPSEETCRNHQITTENVFDYNLYDDTGALVDIQSNIEFRTTADLAGFLGSYTYFDDNDDIQTGFWVWIENNIYPSNNTPITVTDFRITGQSYDLTFNVVAGKTKLTAVRNNTTNADHVFDKPILFDTSSSGSLVNTVVPLTDRNDVTDRLTKADFPSDSMVYMGPGRLQGGLDGNEANFADGTELTSANTVENAPNYRGKKYYVKAMYIENTPTPAPALSSCAALAQAMVGAASETLPTIADIVINAPTVLNEPVVAGRPLITDGALTPD